MADIFVSYAKEDRLYAQQTVTALQAAGYSVWWDDDITPHGSWDATIERELNAAKAVLVLWTPRSIESEFVRAEANWAKNQNKLVPVQLEACPLPIAFSMVQTANLTGWKGEAGHPEWQRVLNWIASYAAPSGDPVPAAVHGIGSNPNADRDAIAMSGRLISFSRFLLGLIILCALAGLGYAGLSMLRPSGPTYVAAAEAGAPSCTRLSSRAFLDPIDGGTCFQCGVDFKRTAAPVTSDSACEKPGGNGSFPAVKVGNDGPGIGNCPGGFMDLTVKGCWSCQGGTRTMAPITANDACTGERPPILARPERLGAPVCAEDAFQASATSCMTCPTGSTRTEDNRCKLP